MKLKVKRKQQRHVRSGDLYRRRTVKEMTRIVMEIQSGTIGIRAASRKHKICRPTLQKWISRLSVINLGEDLSNKLLAAMTERSDVFKTICVGCSSL